MDLSGHLKRKCGAQKTNERGENHSKIETDENNRNEWHAILGKRWISGKKMRRSDKDATSERSERATMTGEKKLSKRNSASYDEMKTCVSFNRIN